MKLAQLLCYFAFAVSSLVFVLSTASDKNEGGANNRQINNPRISAMDNPRNGQATTIFAKLIHRDLVVRPPLPDDDYDDGYVQVHARPLRRTGLFFVNVSIGTPPQPQLLVMDTGSSPTVVRQFGCVGCENEQVPLYKPNDSSTYENSTCKDEYCDGGIFTACDNFYRCLLRVSYGDRRNGLAALTRDTFRFITSDGRLLDIPNVAFGCTNKMTWKDLDGTNGVLGLGPRVISLVMQRFYRFSYCIGNFYDRLYDNNLLVLGEQAVIYEANSTPLEITAQYYIRLEAISVGGSRLDITPEGVRAIMDTGTTLTYFPKDLYSYLKKEIKKALKNSLVHISDEPNFCYNGKLRSDFDYFPLVTLHFADDARLYLKPKSLFVQHSDGSVCLGVKITNTEFGNVALIGMLAQQNYNIVYELLEGSLSMKKIDCRLLMECYHLIGVVIPFSSS